MGRNAGSQIVTTHTWNPVVSAYVTTWYCQQHAKWDQIQSSVLATSFASLKTHIETQHGNVEQ